MQRSPARERERCGVSCGRRLRNPRVGARKRPVRNRPLRKRGRGRGTRLVAASEAGGSTRSLRQAQGRLSGDSRPAHHERGGRESTSGRALTDFRWVHRSPSASSGQVLPLPQERVKMRSRAGGDGLGASSGQCGSTRASKRLRPGSPRTVSSAGSGWVVRHGPFDKLRAGFPGTPDRLTTNGLSGTVGDGGCGRAILGVRVFCLDYFPTL